jgi:hypothetical protein
VARPVVNGLRHEYQDRINFVVLDFDREDDLALARRLGVGDHPAFALLEPNSAKVRERRFGPIPDVIMAAWLRTVASEEAE